MSDFSSPLNDGHLAEIKKGLDMITQAEAVANKAKRSGIDMDSQLKELAEQRKMLNAIRANFFPNQ
jgi:hypothetical protein